MELAGKIRKLNYDDLKIFLIPIIIFSIYLAVFNPGTATIDTFNQFHQIASGHFTNWHPFFHTFIEMLCLKVYPSPVSICIMQILVFSTMWTVICKYNRDDGKSLKYQLIATLIICIIPINAIYSITLWKDILFSYFMMFLCFLAKVMIDRQGKVDWRFIVLISLIMAFIAELRGNGMYVVLAVIVIYSAYLFLKRNPKMGILLLAVTMTFIFLISMLNVTYDVENNEKDAMMTKVTHMLANYDMNMEIEKSDQEQIHNLLDKDKIGQYYTPTGSDTILSITNLKEFKNNKSPYIGLAIKYSLKDPIHCLQYLFESSPMVWEIVRHSDWLGKTFFLDGEMDRIQWDFEKYYSKHNYTPTQSYENISYANFGTPAFTFLNHQALDIEGNFISNTLLNSPALYMYLSIIILILMHFITKSREIWLMYVPNLLNIIIVFMSTPVQDTRYLYANLLVCYLLIIILIGLRHQFPDKWKNSIKMLPTANRNSDD